MRRALLVLLLIACSKGGGQTADDAQPAAVVKPPACAADADCRLFDDYCTGCDCRALAKTDPDPVCPNPGVRCFRQPCADRRPACDKGKCVVR